jgi:diguanylate cyclase (GGDEF)-like protein
MTSSMPRATDSADKTDSSAERVADRSSLSAIALNTISRAVALFESSGELVLSNPRFEALLDGDGIADLRDLLRNEPEPLDGRLVSELVLRDGRILCVEASRHAHLRVVSAEDISELKRQHLVASAAARTDPLTGLGNRRVLEESLGELLKGLGGDNTVAAVLAIDLDRFKTINDTLGHPLGDALLKAVADRLRSVLREDDIAARIGGDEFGVIQIARNQPDAARALAKRLVDLLGRSYIVNGHLLNIGASVGVSLVPGDGRDEATVLRSADLALYRAKQTGRGTFCFFEPQMNAQMEERRNLELDLRRALAMREFSLAYQPQFNLATRQITGFEALLRWQNGTRGSVSPATFIPLAEEIGIIVPIGEWVIRAACQEAARWPENLHVAVNVSSIQFASPDLVPTVKSALAESGLDPQRLEIEITESVLLGDHETALGVLHEIRGLGVRVSMDDFGTGYSSLSYLRSFPFDKIKIDQSFVRGNKGDATGLAIVRAVAALGQSLGMTTTAEGVETEEQLAFITEHGCTDAQGYFISRPMPPADIAAYLSRQARANDE